MSFGLIRYCLDYRKVHKNIQSDERALHAEGADADNSEEAIVRASQLLGVTLPINPDALQSAYRARMGEYDQERLRGLGEDLGQLAALRRQAIQAAFEQLQQTLS
jgi:hypothetical protein